MPMESENLGFFSKPGAEKIARHVRRFGDKVPKSNRQGRRRPQLLTYFPIRLVWVSGSDGTKDSTATWTYNVYHFGDTLDAEALALGVNPESSPHEYRRETGLRTKATSGEAFIFDQELIITDTNEVKIFGPCTDP